jgi:hypothetical protein
MQTRRKNNVAASSKLGNCAPVLDEWRQPLAELLLWSMDDLPEMYPVHYNDR